MIPMEISRSLKLSTTKAILLFIQVVLFLVLFFPEAQKVSATILWTNFLILIPTNYFIFFSDKLQRLTAPAFFKRALLIQMLMHFCIFGYWGYYNHKVLEHIPLIVHQMAFVHLFYFFCCMFFNKKFVLSLSLIPLTNSINLFVWFSPKIYIAHIVLLILAILAKLFVTRKINGKQSHIFNPSAIVLCLAIVVLILFPRVHEIYYGPEIGAFWLIMPNFDLFLFVLSCITLWTPNRYLISIGAIGFLIGADFITDFATGMPLIAELAKGSVLLGTTLLIADPATSPNTKLGQILFGLTYGFSIAIAFTIFSYFLWNTYYDKLFFVCLLNYFSPHFDRLGNWIKAKIPNAHELSRFGKREVLLAFYLFFFWFIYPRFERRTPPPFFMNWYSLKSLVSSGN